MVGKKNAVQVVVFMLDDPGFYAWVFFFQLFSFFVHVGNPDVFFSSYIFMDAGDAETSFIPVGFIAPAFEDMCIDECFAEAFAIGIYFFKGVGIDGEDADVASYLGAASPTPSASSMV